METTLGQVRGLEYVNRVEVMLDGERIHLAEVGGAEDYVGSADNATDVLNNINARLTVRVPVTAGPHAIAAAFLGRSATQGGNRLQYFQRTNVDTTDHTGLPHIESVTLTGPFNAAGAGRTPEPRPHPGVPPVVGGAGVRLRETDRRDAGAPRLSPAGRRRRRSTGC